MKDFFTYEQQIDRLKNYGLIIDDEKTARELLEHEGYYNLINGYSPIFRDKKTDRFLGGAKFEDVRNLYVFDKNLRSIVYKYTSSIECNVKAIIGHEFSRVHGVDENKYLTAEAFTGNANCAAGVERLIAECKETIDDALNPHSNKYRKYIQHNHSKHGHVPFWVLIRALSFGTTSIFYKYMKDEEKDVIANIYKLSAPQLENILEIIISFRNVVAHGERTYCAKLPRARLTTNLSVTRKLKIPPNAKGENKFGRNDFLALLIACKYMLNDVEYAGLIYELDMGLQELAKHLSPSMMGRIKIQMGLWSDSWKNLTKFKL